MIFQKKYWFIFNDHGDLISHFHTKFFDSGRVCFKKWFRKTIKIPKTIKIVIRKVNFIKDDNILTTKFWKLSFITWCVIF